MFSAHRHVIAAHEAIHVTAVANFDPSQPFHVGDTVPTGNDQPQRRAVAICQGDAIALVGQEQIETHCVIERQAAPERHVDRQFARRSLAKRLGLPVMTEKHDLIRPRLNAAFLEDWQQRRARPTAVVHRVHESGRRSVAGTFERHELFCGGAAISDRRCSTCGDDRQAQ